jgi:type 1 glutamine amidotransferase
MKISTWMLILFSATALAQVSPDQLSKIEAAIPKAARATPQKIRRVLIWNTPFMDKSPHKGYTIPHSEAAFRLMGQKTKVYDPVVSDDVAMFLPDNLVKYDVIVMNNSDGPWIRPTEKDMDKFKTIGSDIDAVEKILRQSLLDWVASGRGIVAIHYAIGANTHWSKFQDLLGATYSGHPWNEEVGVKVEEPTHPLVAAFGGKDFRIADEIFQFRQPYDRSKLRVLLSLDTKTTNMTVPWIERKDGDFALAWIRSHGKGRVFYSAIGHRTEIWSNPQILQFYLDAVQFAAGDLPALIMPD